MTAFAIAVAIGLQAVSAGGVKVYVISPDPATSAMVVAPMIEVAGYEGWAPKGAVVWVAAECDELDEELSGKLARWMEDGGIVVVEDAPRLARGALSEAAEMRVVAAPGEVSAAEVVHRGHPATVGVPVGAWRLRPGPEGVPEVGKQARVVVRAEAGWPVVWSVTRGKGKIVCLAANRRGSRPVELIGYDALLTQLLLAVSGAPAAKVAEAAARGAVRAWIYLDFLAGQAAYRLRARAPEAYYRGRAEALRAMKVAGAKPAEALRLVAAAARHTAEAAAWAHEYWRRVPVEAVRKASQRREIVLSPGTLDVVHSMNVSVGASGLGLGRPASGRQLWPGDLADSASAAATRYWRGLKPLLSLPAELPLAVNPELRQVDGEGKPLWAPRWLSEQVQELLRGTVPLLEAGTIVFYCEGQPWAAGSCDPRGDYSLQARRLYAEEAAAAGVKETEPPKKWEPSRRWLVWQKVRAACGRARWKALAEAVHQRQEGAMLLVDAGFGGDVSHCGPSPETGFCHVDGAAPVMLANYGVGFDPADVVSEVRWTVGLMDGDGDGRADSWPGAVARFRWADALALKPEAHALVGALALAAGARGVMQTWAQSSEWSDAALACPEDVYVRWEASFAAALELHGRWLSGRPVCDAAVWRSWMWAAMARPGDEAEKEAAAAVRRWGRVVAQAGFVPKFVGDATIEAGGLDGVRVVVVPSVLCASSAATHRLEEYVRGGGVVLMGPGSLAFDEVHQPAKRGDLAAGLDGGVKEADDVAVKQVARAEKALDVKARFGRLASGVWTPARRVKVLAKRGDGRAAVWAWKLGRGWVIYFAAEPGPDARWATWLAGQLEAMSCRPVARASDGARCVAERLEDGRLLVAVYNSGPVGQQRDVPRVAVTVDMPGRGGEVAELIVGLPGRYDGAVSRPVPCSVNGGQVVFQTTLRAHRCRFFLVAR